MTAQELCERLLETDEATERATLLDEAAITPEAEAFAREQARNAVSRAPRTALRYAELAVEIAMRRAAWAEAAAGARARGQALRAMGRHAEALEALEAAAAFARQAGDPRLAAQVQIGNIDSLGMLGQYRKAFALAQRLEDELRALGADEDAAKALCNAGSLHFRRDRYAEALSCYRQAEAILERSGDPILMAAVELNIANALTPQNRIEEALTLFERARALYAENDLPTDAAIVDTNVGFLQSLSGRHALALASLTRAHAAFVEHGQELEAARCDVDMVEAYRALNLFPEALDCCERALAVFDRLPLDYDRARAELNRAVLIARQQPEEALAALERAEAIFRRQRNVPQRAHVRLMRATLLRTVEQVEAACQEARSAARAFGTGGLPGWAAEARFLLADVDMQEGRNAVRRMRAVSRVARTHTRGWLECRAERALGLHYARRADTDRALECLRAGVAALEQARTLIAPEEMHIAFLRDKLAIYEDLVGLLLARGREEDLAEALECVERSRSRLLLERVQDALEGRSFADEGMTVAQERLASLRAELSRLYQQERSLGEDDPRRLAGSGSVSGKALPLESAYRTALRDIEMARYARLPSGLRPVTASTDALCAALAADETLVEFYAVGAELCAFLVNGAGVRVHQGLAGLEDVRCAARRLRYHRQKMEMASAFLAPLQQAFRMETEAALRGLYDLLLRPLEARLPTEKLIVVPYGLLHGLPFHAFHDGARYALDRWEFLYTPSASVWLMGKERAANATVHTGRSLLMGIPAAGIERVAAEVAQLAQVLPEPETYCGENATLAAFHQSAPRSRRIHLATHARFREDNPLFSGLQFADGWLLARDLYDLALECDLATLSACDTGVACVEPGDELFGLIRGFLAAGARSVAASLWPADDAATAEAMTRFYALLSEGQSKASALRAAQRATRERYPHPYHWAAFVLVGQR